MPRSQQPAHRREPLGLRRRRMRVEPHLLRKLPEKLRRGQERVEDVDQLSFRTKMLHSCSKQRGLARPTFTGQHNKALVVTYRVIQRREYFEMTFSSE